MNSGSTDKLDKMDDKRFRFTEKEKSVLFSLFKQYQDVIDIRHRRYSQSHHKQAALRNCWNKILEEFNASPDTGNRSMKQIQKFWLNSKLRNRLPSTDGKQKKESNSNKKSSDAAYRELAKSCKAEEDDDDEEEEEDTEIENIAPDAQGDQTHEIEVVNVADTFDGHYENLNESYFENNGEAITLKVIDNQINYALPTPSATSLVAIPQGGQVNATLVTVPTSEINKKTTRSLSNPPNNGTATTYIAYSQIKDNNSPTTDNQNVHSTRSYVLTSSANSTPATVANRNISIHQSTTENDANVNDSILFELQRQEMELKVREAKVRVEIQEMEKDKKRQELIHMREIHCLKIKEMEQRLRNIERS